MGENDPAAGRGILLPPTSSPRRFAGRSRIRPTALLFIAIVSAALLSSMSSFSKLGSHGASRHEAEDPSFSPPVDARGRRDSGGRREWSLSNRYPTLRANGTRSKFVPRSTSRGADGGGGDGPDRPPSPTGGLHTCACLADDYDDPRNGELPPRPGRVRWLHIPKTGTSFVSTLWSRAASNSDRYIDLGISSQVCGTHDDSSFSMYDFALMRRYPWELYGAPTSLAPRGNSSGPIGKAGGDAPLGLVGGTQHTPLGADLKDERFTSSQHYKRVRAGLRRHGSEVFEHGIAVAAFFRQPEERIVSAYYDGRHSSGFPPDAYKQLVKDTLQRGPKHRCKVRGQEYANPLECFARHPGIAGCMTRMLTGENCADGVLHEGGLENLPRAVDMVMNHLDFVGLTEEWNESICQFHRLFSGRADESTGGRRWDPPLQGEFSNVHRSTKKKPLGVEDLHGFADVVDTVLYETVKLKFQRMVGAERCYRYVTPDGPGARRGDNRTDEPEARRGENRTSRSKEGDVCKPKSCSDLNKQCGEWDDGCNRTVICGMCHSGRTGLPSTWRVRCADGRCVDHCPPWEDEGYLFASEDSPRVLKVFRDADGRPRGRLSPTDAVEICATACSDESYAAAMVAMRGGVDPFVGTGLCRCGDAPKMLLARLSPRDFSAAHDMNATCKESRARKLAVLAEADTQPVCCPPLPPRLDPLPPGWRRLYATGGPNLEGEYFASVGLGCGAFGACAEAARARGAETATFDPVNSMCYMARGVVDLGDAFTATKDNQNRYVLDLRPGGSPIPGRKTIPSRGMIPNRTKEKK